MTATAPITPPPAGGLAINPRIALVPVAVACTKFGCAAEDVFAMVDEGKLRFVFDVARKGAGELCRRFWIHELVDQDSVAGIDLCAVLDRIFPPARAKYAAREVCLRLAVSDPKVHELRREQSWPLFGDIPRAPLVTYLRAQWIGGGAC